MTFANKELKTRIVVGTDLSERGAHALRTAIDLARRVRDCELHVAHVIPIDNAGRRMDAMDLAMRTKLAALHEHVIDAYDSKEDCAPFSQDAVLHVRFGAPAKAIHQLAVDVDADMIVIGTRGLRGVDRLILGSVAEELVRIAHCAVTVARPKDFTGLSKSERPEPRRPDQQEHSVGLTDHLHLEFPPRNSHISGLI